MSLAVEYLLEAAAEALVEIVARVEPLLIQPLSAVDFPRPPAVAAAMLDETTIEMYRGRGQDQDQEAVNEATADQAFKGPLGATLARALRSHAETLEESLMPALLPAHLTTLRLHLWHQVMGTMGSSINLHTIPLLLLICHRFHLLKQATAAGTPRHRRLLHHPGAIRVNGRLRRRRVARPSRTGSLRTRTSGLEHGLPLPLLRLKRPSTREDINTGEEEEEAEAAIVAAVEDIIIGDEGGSCPAW